MSDPNEVKASGPTETGLVAYAIDVVQTGAHSYDAMIVLSQNIGVSVTDGETSDKHNNTSVLGDLNTRTGQEQLVVNVDGFNVEAYYYGITTINGVTGFIVNTGEDGQGLWFFITPASVKADSLYAGATGKVDFDTTGASSPYQWSLTGDGPVCFMAGTMIATAEGEAAVETLQPGDLVRCADGSLQPVRWLGRQTISRLFADPLRVAPIRISAGALGDGLPRRDLRCSPDHAFLLDGVLVQAGALVNGVSIIRESEMPVAFTYYHVELAGHMLMLAEGAPAESFIDHVDRLRFDNWDAHEAALRGEPQLSEMNLPRVKSARQLPGGLRARLLAQAGLLAEAQKTAA